MSQLIKIENFELEPFFNLSPDNLCIIDFKGYVKKINPAFIELLGYTKEELYSRPISEFVHEADRNLTLRHGENLTNNIPILDLENRYVTKSGKVVWLYWTAIPSEDNELVYAIARDVTHKKELENERVSLFAGLVQTNEKLTELNHITSHDLKSPVNNLIYLVDMLDTSKIDDEFTLKTLEHIKRSADGLKTSLNAYVDAVDEYEISEEELEKVCFIEVFKEVKESISALATTAKVEFVLDFTEVEYVMFKRKYLNSIFLNLVSNSIKYAQPGVIPVISITSQIEGGLKKLIYVDNGLGFDMEKVGHLIFDLNQRFHDSDDSKGLGLYLVKKYVTNLGGSIKVNSQVDQGSTFTIVFGE